MLSSEIQVQARHQCIIVMYYNKIVAYSYYSIPAGTAFPKTLPGRDQSEFSLPTLLDHQW